MLTKIIAIKNVGRFRQSAGPAVPQLSRHVMVLGANGFGKTTLCAILRSLQTGDIDHVTGRRTVGVEGACEVNLLTPTGNVQFGAAGWTKVMPEILIFDGIFVAQNVHAGDVVELEQRRNLYRVIIGQEGVGLAEQDTALAADSRAKAAEVTAASKALQTHLPPGMKLEAFLTLAEDLDIDARIAEQMKTVAAIGQAEQLRTRTTLAELSIPQLPSSFFSTLLKTIEDLAGDAELQVAAHVAAHEMTSDGEAWLAQGMPFTGQGKCPFCGQSLEGLALISAYRALFSEAYSSLKDEICALREAVETEFGDRVIGRLTTQAATNASNVEFWKQYCTLPANGYELPTHISETIGGLREAVLALSERKAHAPLEAIDPRTNAAFIEHKAGIDQAQVLMEAVTSTIREANLAVSAKKAVTAAGDLPAAEAALKRLMAVKKRHEKAVAEACTAYGKLEAEKAAIETCKSAARAKLEEHSDKVVVPYEQRINALLDDFNAGFRITKTKHVYPGGIATSSYQLVINETAVDVGDGKTALSKPSFKNTLSAGDRTTLALAFFIASLERDPERANRIVVFDDPFNSQDAFRRLNTQFQIRKTGANCAQVFVLSHDASFLHQVWCKCPPDQRTAVQLSDHGFLGSKIAPCNLEDACKGRVANEIDDLVQYQQTSAGKPHDIIKKMRVVLETYCRSTFPNCFLGDDNLGEIVRKIRDIGDTHPAYAMLDELDRINDFSVDHHHGEDPTDGPETIIDSTELKGFVRKTLRLSNNLQA